VGIMSGAMTVRRFRVVGDVPDDYRDAYRRRLDEYAFRERPTEQGKEEVEGWVQVHNLLDAEFEDLNRWLYNNLAVFSLRVDKKSLPAALFRATLQKKCEAWCKDRGSERCPSSVKKQLKEELEAEWLKRTLPRVAITECCWNITEGYLLLHSLSETSADRFKKRFHRTFGLKLVAWSPLDWLQDEDSTERMLSVGPANLMGELLQEEVA
jgi:recombination associated protein RdgC